jgi:hypothetical protein
MRMSTGKLKHEFEPGTIVGPDTIGEFHVALSCVDGVTTFGYATPVEIAAALARDPQSVAEVKHRARLVALL